MLLLGAVLREIPSFEVQSSWLIFQDDIDSKSIEDDVIQSRFLSDPSLSDIDFKNEMTLDLKIWTTLNMFTARGLRNGWKITEEINSAGINAPLKLKDYNSHRSNQKSDKFYSCARGPHYKCDHKDCCFHLRTPMFTFEKRLVGYIRYAAFEWWKQGLTWPPKN